MSIQESVDGYIDYFRRQLALVDSLRADESITVGASKPSTRLVLHKKILQSAMLDSFSAVRYSTLNLSNHDRFVGLLKEHSGWSTGPLVSVPILAERLKGTASPLTQQLAGVLAKHSTLRGNSLPLTAFDADVASLEALTQDDVERTAISKCVHYSIPLQDLR